MPTKRISRDVLQQDVASINGLSTISGYQTHRPEATTEGLQTAYRTMLAKQQLETEQQVLAREAAEAARQAEQDFHNAVLAMKEAVRGQFGSDGKEAVAIGLKRKSDRKLPTRRAKAAVADRN
ncbi:MULTISPECIES: hypothetical protein [Leptolyngbya]|uniref:hypothetical protein n=1 Tax=Leptolyngbya TaxID=47251 RepID=UPI00168401D7|nr:hypothetical protein [Leptolyngbya sp. FACHB-1624]MBD1858354.1 hypothetical protein [Leptolyngbya sp. FACHB-1624]